MLCSGIAGRILTSICFQENSFLRSLGHIDLDLPQPPEKATRPPLQPVDPLSRFGPKAEISHIFRAPEKRPPKELSLAFLVLALVPLAGFLLGVSQHFFVAKMSLFVLVNF